MRFSVVKLTWYRRNLKAGKTKLCCWSKACARTDWNSDAFLIIKTALSSHLFLACGAFTYHLSWVPGGSGQAAFPSCIHAWSPVACIDCNHVLDALSQLICCMPAPVPIPICSPCGAPTTTVLCCVLTVAFSCHRQELHSSLHQQNGISTSIPHGERINQQK